MPTRPLMPSSVHDGMDKIGETKPHDILTSPPHLLPFGLDSADPLALVPIGQLLCDQINQVGLTRFHHDEQEHRDSPDRVKKGLKRGSYTKFPDEVARRESGRDEVSRWEKTNPKNPYLGGVFPLPRWGEFKSPDGRVRRESGGKPFFQPCKVLHGLVFLDVFNGGLNLCWKALRLL